MSNYDNTNRGAIFKNDKKTEEKHPDYRGTINVDGNDKQISLWVKTSKDGKKYFSASISEPYKKSIVDELAAETIPTRTEYKAEPINLESDDLPF
jgi:uncharacterized protein (DUF736 family)